jgi:hypothetical protein
MTDTDPAKATPPDGKTTIMTVRVHPDDVERIMKAFAEAKLEELGIIDISFKSPHEPSIKEWTEKETEKEKRKRSTRDAPPQ